MILLDQIVEVLATPHLNVLPLRLLQPQKPKGQVALFEPIERDLARPPRRHSDRDRERGHDALDGKVNGLAASRVW
jgi:hypothetical protein